MIWEIIGRVDLSLPSLRYQKPTEADTIGAVFLHFSCEIRDVVTRGCQLDDEVWRQRQETVFVVWVDCCQALAQHPCGIGGAG